MPMKQSIYDEIGGFVEVRKLIVDFYDKVLNEDELAGLFQNLNMERIIDHQTKFFAMLLGGPASFSDEELRAVHQRLGINNEQFDLTLECLTDTLEDFELKSDYVTHITDAFESKRELIVQ